MIKIGSHVSMGGKKMLLGASEEAASYGANVFMVYTGAPQNTKRRPIVLHPGAHVKAGDEAGIQKIIEGLNEVLTHEQKIQIALETMAGKGTEVGRTFEQLAAIIDGVVHNEKLSVCFDTCHTHDAGYAVSTDFDSVLNEFDKIIGIDRLKVLHINDSKNVLGARKDRHENIGFGHIGFDALYRIVHHPQLTDVPKILETPYIGLDKAMPPYKQEIEMLRTGCFDSNWITTILHQEP